MGNPLPGCRITLVAAAFFVAALAVASAQGLEQGESAPVREVVDGDTLVLARPIDGATKVRLVGIQAPKLPLGRAGFRAWPLAEEARQALVELAQGRELTLSFGGASKDRYGRLLAHLHDPAGTWIQGEMLRRGMTRVYSFADNRAVVAEMLALEREARQAGRGVWNDPFYAIRTPEEASRHLGSFQIVEATVLAATRKQGRIYLNFGPDWRTDFTAAIGTSARTLFVRQGLDPLDLAGRRIRLRGWIARFNGPLIEVTHPEQIEVLGE